jgi:hypothetical protein
MIGKCLLALSLLALQTPHCAAEEDTIDFLGGVCFRICDWHTMKFRSPALQRCCKNLACTRTYSISQAIMRLQLLGALGELGGVDTKPGCEFECPAGHKPLARHNHVPSHNGCGSYGLKVGSWRLREGISHLASLERLRRPLFRMPGLDATDLQLCRWQVTSEYDFEKCCEVHDICYDTCGTSKVTCDEDFKKCMKKVCG